VNLELACLKIMGKLAGCDKQSLGELNDMKIPSLGITQHFANEVDWVLDLTISVHLPSFDDDGHTDHVAHS
jgi:hypothetical protein